MTASQVRINYVIMINLKIIKTLWQFVLFITDLAIFKEMPLQARIILSDSSQCETSE